MPVMGRHFRSPQFEPFVSIVGSSGARCITFFVFRFLIMVRRRTGDNGGRLARVCDCDYCDDFGGAIHRDLFKYGGDGIVGAFTCQFITTFVYASALLASTGNIGMFIVVHVTRLITYCSYINTTVPF